MHKRTSAAILAGVLVTGAAGAAVAITPASAATSGNLVTSRLASIKSALSGLVGDGTLTQTQADKVASTLDSKLPKRPKAGMGGPGMMGGPGGHFGMMGGGQTDAAAAKALGLTVDKLHTALRSGKSLADVAKDQKVSVDSLVTAMVTAAKAQLATAVKDGRLTQAQADQMTTLLTQRMTDRVNDVRPDRGPGRGPRGADGFPPTSGTSAGTSNVAPSTT